MKNSYATNRNPSIVPESYELYLKIQNAFYKINYDSDNNCYNVDIHDSNNNDLGKVLGDDTYNKIKIYYVNSSSIWVWKGTEKGYDVGTEFVTFQRKNGQVLITECERSRNLSYYK
jgi:hypothetical protein